MVFSGNVSSFSASVQRYSYLFWRRLTFLDISWPQLSLRHYAITISPHVLRIPFYTLDHLQHLTTSSPTRVQTSFRNRLPPKDVLKSLRFYIHIRFFVPHYRISKFLQSLSITFITICANSSDTAHHNIRTNVLVRVFFLGLKQISASTTHSRFEI